MLFFTLVAYKHVLEYLTLKYIGTHIIIRLCTFFNLNTYILYAFIYVYLK
eukprot:UN06200